MNEVSQPALERLRSARALLFDYGNTLIEYGPAQLRAQYAELTAHLSELGAVDATRLEQARLRQIAAPEANSWRENNLFDICAELIEEVVGVQATTEQTQRLVERRCHGFYEAVQVRSDVRPVLSQLAQQYTLGLVSNYPCGDCIRDTLKKNQLRDLFQVVVVSADCGYCKPHPEPFQRALRELSVPAEQAIYVGDNWVADVQGAKRLGMSAVLITEFLPYQQFERRAEDHQQDATISALSELPSLMLK